MANEVAPEMTVDEIMERINKQTDQIRSSFIKNDEIGFRAEIFDAWLELIKELGLTEGLSTVREHIEDRIKQTEGGDAEFIGGVRHGLEEARTIIDRRLTEEEA